MFYYRFNHLTIVKWLLNKDNIKTKCNLATSTNTSTDLTHGRICATSSCVTHHSSLLSRMKLKEGSVSGLPREYSENASIHGIAYIFSAKTAVEKFIW